MKGIVILMVISIVSSILGYILFITFVEQVVKPTLSGFKRLNRDIKRLLFKTKNRK